MYAHFSEFNQISTVLDSVRRSRTDGAVRARAIEQKWRCINDPEVRKAAVVAVITSRLWIIIISEAIY